MAAAVQTDGTDQSTHRISNERLLEFPGQTDPVLISNTTTPLNYVDQGDDTSAHMMYQDRPSQKSLV